MTQAADILDHLCTDVFQEVGGIQRVNTAREDELLPDQDAITIAEIVKALIFIESTAPDAQHVLVRLGCRTDQPFQLFASYPGGEGVSRSPVGALDKDRDTVDYKDKGASPLVFLLAQFNRTQPKLVRSQIQKACPGRIARFEGYFHLIKGLLAVAIGPPKLRFGDRHIHNHLILTGYGNFFFDGPTIRCRDKYYRCERRLIPTLDRNLSLDRHLSIGMVLT